MRLSHLAKQSKILVTGGAGYIGSHTIVELLEAGLNVVAFDNFSNSSKKSLKRVEKITNRCVDFVKGDVRNSNDLARVFKNNEIEAVMHFAGLKAVGESVKCPVDYYDNNVLGSINLLSAMEAAGVFTIVFSSSATVYGEPEKMPISEDFPTFSPTNPYGKTKLFVEEILKDLAASDSRWNIAILRYFNPIGAHSSGLIGDNPNGMPNNLLPYVSRVAIGQLPSLSIYGNDYPTKDGTGVRDYIHIVDLAAGHLSALHYIKKQSGAHIWNLGTGKGYSVLEIVKEFELVINESLDCVFSDRRVGDVAECWSDPGKAFRELGWTAKKSIRDMVEDTWRWQKSNPHGYDS